jgi:hypothetical protein
MKAYGGVDVWIPIFLTSALVRRELSASHPDCFTPGERAPGTLWKGGWVGPRTCLDGMEKRKFLTLPGLELRPLLRPSRRQLLYLPSCHGSIFLTAWSQNFFSQFFLNHMVAPCWIAPHSSVSAILTTSHSPPDVSHTPEMLSSIGHLLVFILFL